MNFKQTLKFIFFIFLFILATVGAFKLFTDAMQYLNRPLLDPRGSHNIVLANYIEPTPIINPKADPRRYFRWKGQQLGYDDYFISKFYKLIENESHWDPNARNPNSTAVGIGQILIGTWEDPRYQCSGQRTNFIDNIDCTYNILKVSGMEKPWKDTWDKLHYTHEYVYKSSK